jgi:hypothetical protein
MQEALEARQKKIEEEINALRKPVSVKPAKNPFESRMSFKQNPLFQRQPIRATQSTQATHPFTPITSFTPVTSVQPIVLDTSPDLQNIVIIPSSQQPDKATLEASNE